MTDTVRTLNRRAFIKTGVQLTAAGTVALHAGAAVPAAAAPRSISIKTTIPLRDLGKTGYRLPILGHGGSALMGREYKYYGLSDPPALEDRIKMVRAAYDKGIRYFDTARIYAESEQIFGQALKDVRDDIFIASKVLVDSPERVRASVEKSLQELQMDSVDCMQIHGPSIERLKYDGAMKIHDELVKLREEGKFKYIGMTGHNAFEEMYKMIASGAFDQVLIEYGYFHKGYNTRHSDASIEWRENCIAKAHELKMGIVAMKVLGAFVYNHNAKTIVEGYDPEAIKRLPQAAVRWVMRDERISILNIGVSLTTDTDENIRIFTGDLGFTNEDRLLLADFSARAYLHPSVQEMPVV